MGRLCRCIKKTVSFGLLCAFITFCPGIPPNATYVPFGNHLKALQKLNLDPILNNAERLLEGQLVGPEAFAVHKGALYTGLHGGHVVKVLPNKVVPIGKTGKECAGIHQEHICGRPLGLRFRNDVLYIADGYYGIFSHVISDGPGRLNHLLGPNIEVNGKPMKVINSLEVGSDGAIYFTSSSSEFDINKGLHAVLSSGTGSLLKFDPTTKKVTQLLDNMYFPNGLAISADEEFLFVAETVARRVLKYHIKTGNVQTILEGLPGNPDNIQHAGDNTFWVSLVSPSDEEHPSLTDVLADWPNIRKFLGRLLFLAEFPFKFINQYYPNNFCEQAAYNIGHLGPIFAIIPEKVTIIRFDGKNGQIFEALHGNDGSAKAISDIAIVGDYMYLGSPVNNFIGRVMLPKGKYAQTEEALKFKSDSQSHVKKAAEEAQAKKAAEEAKAKRVAEEAKAKKAAEEAKAKKAAEEAKAKKATEEAKAKKAAEEAQAKKAAQEAQAKKAAEEAQAKKAAEEAQAKKAAQEAQAKKAAEEAQAKKAAEEAQAKKAAEEAQAKKAAEEAQAKKAAEEAQAKKAAEAAQAKKAAEAAQAKKAAEAAQAKKAAEEAQAKKKAAEEAQAKKAAEEAKARKAAEDAKKAAEAAVKADKIKEAASNKKTSDEIKTNKISDDVGKSKVAGDKIKTEL